MIKITFPDGSVKDFQKDVTGFEIAESISKSLAKSAMIIEVNGKEYDLSRPITEDAKIRIFTSNDPEMLEVIRHDAAHILAQAVKELYPSAQITIGPSIENGFYYDISCENSFSTEDLEKIENKMKEISAKNEKFERYVWSKEEAINFFKSQGEFYKAEIIKDIPNDEDLTIYKQGSFLDLCRGPHAPSTGFIKHFKLMKVAGAYWRGNSKNEMLQRIYGTAWATEKQLKDYLFMLEEAEKRDHRKLGKELDLFHFQEEAQGMVFWHPKGWSICLTIEKYIRNKLKKNGYKEVRTPLILDKTFWEKSGHWEKFRENMFAIECEDKTLAVKPMNCPAHVQIFKQGIKSYRDLPIRISEFGTCHRNESSGSLHGLMRVRSFVQDDAHIFCTEEQITNEAIMFSKLLTDIYKDFGFHDIKIKFSDRPDVRAGSDDVWDKAESSLMNAVKELGYDYVLNPGEGAFYGPKLEFVLKDAIGRDWQLGTLQLDFVIPERLEAKYIDSNGEKKTPVMIHRAIIGTFERFIGIYIEECAGRFPVWIAPIQVVFATVTTDLEEYAQKIKSEFDKYDIRSEIDNSNEKIGYKIRNLSNQKIPYIAVIGKKEVENNTVTLRTLGGDDTIEMTYMELLHKIRNETEKYFQ